MTRIVCDCGEPMACAEPLGPPMDPVTVHCPAGHCKVVTATQIGFDETLMAQQIRLTRAYFPADLVFL